MSLARILSLSLSLSLALLLPVACGAEKGMKTTAPMEAPTEEFTEQAEAFVLSSMLIAAAGKDDSDEFKETRNAFIVTLKAFSEDRNAALLMLSMADRLRNVIHGRETAADFVVAAEYAADQGKSTQARAYMKILAQATTLAGISISDKQGLHESLELIPAIAAFWHSCCEFRRASNFEQILDYLQTGEINTKGIRARPEREKNIYMIFERKVMIKYFKGELSIREKISEKTMCDHIMIMTQLYFDDHDILVDFWHTYGLQSWISLDILGGLPLVIYATNTYLDNVEVKKNAQRSAGFLSTIEGILTMANDNHLMDEANKLSKRLSQDIHGHFPQTISLDDMMEQANNLDMADKSFEAHALIAKYLRENFDHMTDNEKRSAKFLLAKLLKHDGKLPQAAEIQKSLAQDNEKILKKEKLSDNNRFNVMLNLSSFYNDLAMTEMEIPDRQSAELHFKKSMEYADILKGNLGKIMISDDRKKSDILDMIEASEATTLHNYAILLTITDRAQEGAAMADEAVAIRRRQWKDPPSTSQQIDLGLALMAKGLAMDAAERSNDNGVTALREAVDTFSASVGEFNYLTIINRGLLALTLQRKGHADEAIAHLRKTIASLKEQGPHPSAVSFVFRFLWLISQTTVPNAASEAFEAQQILRGVASATAVRRMTERRLAGSSGEATALADYQMALHHRELLTRRLNDRIQAGSKTDEPDDALSGELITGYLRSEQLVKTAQERLTSDFPRVSSFLLPQAVPLARTRKALGPEDALLTYSVEEDGVFVMAITGKAERMARVTLPKAELDDLMARIHAGILPAVALDATARNPFDVSAAHELYKLLIAPVADLLTDVRHLGIVPDGPLQALPFQVLISEDPGAPPRNLTDYRNYRWLIDRYSISILPTVSVLGADPRAEGRTTPVTSFLGIESPSLPNQPRCGRADLSVIMGGEQSVPNRPVTHADLCPVPGSRMLRSLSPATRNSDAGVSRARVLRGSEATKDALLHLPLRDYRNIIFWTHGLSAGEFAGDPEPGLILTPNEGNNGYLSASDVAELHLDADIVVLAACKTAVRDQPTAEEGLSSLTRSFLFAGARNVLVTHWPVHVSAADALTGELFKSMATETTGPWTERLRSAMLHVMRQDEHPEYAHPAHWAPFSIVSATIGR